MRTYEKYKDSGIGWVGKVPEDWRKCRFKNIMNLITDASTSNNKIGLENIESGTGKFVQTDSEFEGNGVAFMPHDIVYGKLRPYLQKVWCADFEGNAVGDFFVFRNKCNSVSSFLKYVLLSNNFTQFANGTTYGAKMPRVSSNAILDQEYYIPTLSEQEAIANYLDKKTAEIDKIIAEREKKIELLNELKSSIISRAVTKGINPHAKMKDSGIDWFPFIPCNWEYSSLRHVCKKITDGSHFSPMSQLEGKPYITVTNVRNNKVYVEEALKISDEDFRTLVSTGCQPLPGDILLSKDGTVGRTAIVTSNDYVVLSSLGILRPSSLVDSKYLEYCLNSNALQMQMQMMMDGSALRRITIKKICNLLVLIPPMHEQLSIVKYLDKKIAEVNNSISTIRKECALYKEYKQSLISEVVTGKRKVID